MDLTPDSILEFECENCKRKDGIKIKMSDILDNPISFKASCQYCGVQGMVDTKPFHKAFIDAGIEIIKTKK